MDKEKPKGSLVTFGALGLTLLFMAPADIVEVFSWLPNFIRARLGARLDNFVGLAWIAVVVGGGFYLPLALIINIFLLFRRQAPVWLKVWVWALFIVTVLGAVRVYKELSRWR